MKKKRKEKTAQIRRKSPDPAISVLFFLLGSISKQGHLDPGKNAEA